MNRLHLVLLLLLSIFMTAVQAQQRVSDNQMKANMGNNTIRLTIKDGKTFTATLADNSSRRCFDRIAIKRRRHRENGRLRQHGKSGTAGYQPSAQ